ncbi:DUF1353 domain-containing protein [Brevundimonas bacteroides]|uniref:DUF1353 domain-containing protein n=1 Tax=Brevundimonas bacteroides TaxID=74311 RepID=UPI0006922AA8|nr:DUF1353 domain-containing protein [Brevundimonas bacteroides]
MSSFTRDLIVRVAYRTEHGRRCVDVVEPFAYEVGFEGSGDLVEIEPGCGSDYGSTPRLTWLIDPPFGLCAKSDVVHDELYRTGARPRLEADRIWLEAMGVEAAKLKAEGQTYAPMWWRLLRFAFVRLFGGRSFGPRHPANRPPRRRIVSSVALAWTLGVLVAATCWSSIGWALIECAFALLLSF